MPPTQFNEATRHSPQPETAAPTFTLITLIYNEAKNLSLLHDRALAVLEKMADSWEWLLVDDHSSDGSEEAIQNLCATDPRIRAVRLAKNQGAHVAAAAGLRYARGECAAIMGADLQTPPELIPQMIDSWKRGFQIVWMARDLSAGSKQPLFAKIWYHLILRKMLGFREINPKGIDCYLVDRRVIGSLPDTLLGSSLVVFLKTVGFRQIEIPYQKQPRLHGVSGWSLKRKIQVVLRTVFYYTNLPVRFLSLLTFAVATAGALVCFQRIIGTWIQGGTPGPWHAPLLFCSVALALTALLVGVAAEYVWMVFSMVKGTPPYVVESECQETHRR